MGDLNKLIKDIVLKYTKGNMKRVMAKVITVNSKHKATISIVGTNTQLVLPNKTGEKLVVGDSVHVHYWGNITSGYIAVRNGNVNTDTGGGVGEDLGNGNERFNDYEDNTLTGNSATMNTLKGTNNSIDGSIDANANLVGGSNNSLSNGTYNNNAVFGENNTISGTEVGSDNIVGGNQNTTGEYAFNSLITGRRNELNGGNAIIGGSDNRVYSYNCVVGGYENVCAGLHSTAFGWGNIAGEYSFSAGTDCYTGQSCIAVGWQCVAGVPEQIIYESDKYSYYEELLPWEIQNGSAAFGRGITIEGGGQFGCGQYNAYEPNSAFQIGNGDDIYSRGNCFEVREIGDVYAAGDYNTMGADYSEFEEWLDGNPNNEDRVGHFVTYDGNKIRYANSNDEYILGVVSAKPSIIGDSDIGYWRGRYETDIYERIIYENGKRKTSPDYDPEQKYIPRAKRSEWTPIGTHGKLIVIDDGTCEVNSYCKPADGGIGTKSETMQGAYRVIERLDSTHIRIRIR